MARALTDPAARTDRPRLCLFWRHVRAGGRDRFGGGWVADRSVCSTLAWSFVLALDVVRPSGGGGRGVRLGAGFSRCLGMSLGEAIIPSSARPFLGWVCVYHAHRHARDLGSGWSCRSLLGPRGGIPIYFAVPSSAFVDFCRTVAVEGRTHLPLMGMGMPG